MLQTAIKLPGKNILTTNGLLSLSFSAEETINEQNILALKQS